MAPPPTRRGRRRGPGGRGVRHVLAAALAAGLLAACQSAIPLPEPPPAPSPSPDGRLAQLVPAPVRADGKLIFATDPNYPPMEFPSADGTSVQGVDIELAAAIAAVLDLQPSFEHEAFTAVEEAVLTGRAEVGVAALTIRGRQRRTDAVLYFRTGSQLVAGPAGPDLTAGQLCGRRIAALEGSLQLVTLKRRSKACRRSGRPAITIIGRSDQALVTRLTAQGSVAGMLADSPVAEYAARTSAAPLRLVGPPQQQAPFGMVTSPELPDLARAVRGALQQLIESGYYGDVLRKWHITRGAVSHAQIRWSDRAEKRPTNTRRRGQ